MISVLKNTGTYIKACVARAYAYKNKPTHLAKQKIRVKKLSTIINNLPTLLGQEKIQDSQISYNSYFSTSFPYYTKQHISLIHTSSLTFKVKRCPPELVAPANPTPRELKLLSDIDDQKGLRFNVPLVLFFRNDPSMRGKDPVQVIRQALAKTLEFYYPFAGRLREGPNEKLMVDCTGEGVIFIEADADVTLDQFGTPPRPPFPCFDQLLYDVPGSNQITNSPLLFIQITRLKCGGFIFAIRMNHTMCDAIGIVQFMKSLGEIARGAPKPSVIPVWCREMLYARDPPRITCIHREYQQLPPDDQSTSTILQYCSFFFGPTEIATIRRLLPHHLAQSTSFEVLAAFIWRCRTIALQLENLNQEVRLLCYINARYGRCRLTPPLPDGFYGNAIVSPAAITTVGKLCSRPLEYALELTKKARSEVTAEYVLSVADLMATSGRPPNFSTRPESLEISDITKAKFEDVNFGWGKTIYGGVPQGYRTTTVLIPFTNSAGEQGRLVLIYLPTVVIERFAKEVHDLLNIKE
ncbi:hypothetical protein RIF29_06015 [Crotalaria pallida]|uniref:Uncharacterized protein n=1 Tax=Crotalaria pallida TaxID=3830 RepID=A0AAN9J3S5_CROPI